MSYSFRCPDNLLGVDDAGSGSIATALAAASFTIAPGSDEKVSHCRPVQIISQHSITTGQETIRCPAKLTLVAWQQISFEDDPSRLTMEYRNSASLLHAPACHAPGSRAKHTKCSASGVT